MDCEVQVTVNDRKVKWRVSDEIAAFFMQELAQAYGPGEEAS